MRLKIWKHWVELVKRNINSLRQNSRQHAGQLPIYIRNDGPDVSTLRVRLSQSVCSEHGATSFPAAHGPTAGTAGETLTGPFIRCSRVFFWFCFFLFVCFSRMISIFEIFGWIYSKSYLWQEDQYAYIDPRNVTWFCFGICISFFSYSSAIFHISYI